MGTFRLRFTRVRIIVLILFYFSTARYKTSRSVCFVIREARRLKRIARSLIYYNSIQLLSTINILLYVVVQGRSASKYYQWKGVLGSMGSIDAILQLIMDQPLPNEQFDYILILSRPLSLVFLILHFFLDFLVHTYLILYI